MIMIMNTKNFSDDCLPLLFNISSIGIWENLKSSNVIFGYSLPLLELQILLIFIFIAICHMFLRCIGISQTVSCMIAGLIMGPQLFDFREKSSRKLSFDHALDGNTAINGLSAFGSILFTFLSSVRITRRVVYNSGPLPVLLGILLFVGPLFVGIFLRILFTIDINPHYMPPKKAQAESIMITVIQSSILLPTITYILSELKILNTEFGRLALSASTINDVLGIIAIILITFLGTYKNISHSTAYTDLIAMLIFVFIVFFVVKPTVEWIIEQTPEGKHVSNIYVDIVLLIVLASAAYTTFFNFKYILGPFMVGLIIPEGPPLGSALEAKYEKLTMNVFLPISIAFLTMRCDVMRIIYELDDIKYNIFILAITAVLKLVAAFLPCMYCMLPLKESIAISLLLCSKSFTEILLYDFTLDDTNMSQATYAFLTLHALLNSAIVPVALKSLYDPKRKYIGYQKRNIMSLKTNSSDLRILTCVHRPINISGAIAFLQLLSSPNRNLPIIVTVLHLVKLVGQMVPVLISHSKKTKRLNNNSYINTALLNFKQLCQERLDSMTMSNFIALSHENLMHEDICMLALDQATSMIVVPSGRTWTIDGAFESDNEPIRRLNMSLLECAPCSIGILVDRGHFFRRGKRECNINVGVIFIGGKDDREALSLVKRMIHNPKVRITVIQLKSNQETEYTNWEYVLDHEVIKELKDSQVTKDFAYIEKIVNDGPEVATVVRLLAKEYDLMVVGRNHGLASPDFSGLKEWMELPELGVIGDLLAVRDLRSKLSVVVVQQQHHA